jgi:lysophospholipase L1-like esterase
MPAVIRFVVLFLISTALISCGGSPQTLQSGTQQSHQTNTVVFLGDSLTANWPLSVYFPGKSYVNLGVGGNTTAQMLARFDTDVTSHHPDAVLIWGGTNSVGTNPDEVVEGELQAIYEKTMSAGITPIACTISPRRDPARGWPDYNPHIVAINSWIKEYAAAHGIAVADFYTVTVDAGDGQLRAEFSYDGVHITTAAYQAITPLAAQAIASTH